MEQNMGTHEKAAEQPQQLLTERYVLGFSPHIKDNSSVTKIMLDVLIALVPACIAAIWWFGMRALLVLVVTTATAVLTELVIQLLCRKKVTITDLSAAVTGVLLALNLPVSVPLYVPVVGSVFAIGVVKQCFGGLGGNFVNPALAARAMLMTAWPVAMTTFVCAGMPDTIASATPLAIMKSGAMADMPSVFSMFIGETAGSMGETCAIALIIGGVYLLARKVIELRIPLIYIGTLSVLVVIFNGFEYLPYHIFSGGLLLGAFFMATDYVSSPVTPGAQAVYALGCGVLTFVIRSFTGYNEGVCFSILLMNVAAPLIQRFMTPRIYGEVKGK